MKKIILGLFLILGAVSFAMPSFINTTKVQKSGYSIIEDSETALTIAGADIVDGDSILVASFYLSDMSPKELSDAIKAEAQQQDAKFVASFDNNRAYVNEFKHVDFYSFTIVPKKQKINKYHIYVTYMSPKKLSKEDINKVINATLNEAEGLIK
ncbi:hypothetical protein ACW0TN_12265 [Fusobacterium pseudoperiodonticum]|uniref:Uncharacterized protein n=1 Tax=Fusobacterium pseudoperiodonticum TaxID=2663009 RepID=A0AAD0F0N1_9FUSO|nr:hypothetical protein [Fusobacterium pseudoperiodonticum]ATV36516.1 hypothetical protein CTM64_11285 [Fusobacterium pseudoperiodonticum]ATV60579.1 hypothetical protein CTM74_01045 [Fusobacterium pseudoperiodonticum]